MELTPLNILLLVAGLINGATFLFFGFDKWMARSQTWRVSEKLLWVLALIGGSVGALIGMSFFRHKTSKASFQFVLALIILLQCLGIWLLFTYTNLEINL